MRKPLKSYPTRLALALAVLAATPVVATAQQPLQMPSDYLFDSVASPAVAVDNAEQISYLSGCCDEPSCGCDSGDCFDCGDDCGAGCGDTCGCGCPTCKKKAAKPSPCATSHKGVFYANDFSYLKKPCGPTCLGDCMKLMDAPIGTLDIGGQLRLRYHHEEGMGRSALSTPSNLGFLDTTNDFMLTRLRLYTNWKVNDWFRVYAEGISADVVSNDSYNPRPIDRNSGDFLNLFFDVGLTDSTTVRVGRQELIYGAQRHVSPLDWANTRRTFEGVKVMHKSDDWAIDGFYTNYVPVSADDFDEADYNQSFYGVYATYTGAKSASYDLFYLGYDNENPYAAVPPVFGASAGSADFSIHTFGGRMFGGSGDWLYEMEAALQTGRQSGLGLDHRAGMCTCGVGRNLGGSWSPTLWVYYDYASGNDSPADGVFNRYNQLFPLAHKYLGFIDAAARSNISSPNCLLTMKPSSKLSLLAWYYYLGAAEAGDSIPGVAVPSAQVAGTDFGNELDLIAKYQLDPRSNILFGYSNLWRGSKIIGTDNANFFYTQLELDF
ncbi:hypothetical protein Pla123a_26380 [Posidoniimonas polymericola]|uniref:Alginate export domain-containing protein n=1 Tax=Posidoniimonas polymericola TaxID=2528002 RepID=A0A5C5YLY2_9BACT|nr:alginate export family protein [Posidoniimonas polymericola]TWT75855.1 hypothetical protein Pla123a_26380 [Posidoniimonas polymericola]